MKSYKCLVIFVGLFILGVCSSTQAAEKEKTLTSAKETTTTVAKTPSKSELMKITREAKAIIQRVKGSKKTFHEILKKANAPITYQLLKKLTEIHAGIPTNDSPYSTGDDQPTCPESSAADITSEVVFESERDPVYLNIYGNPYKKDTVRVEDYIRKHEALGEIPAEFPSMIVSYTNDNLEPNYDPNDHCPDNVGLDLRHPGVSKYDKKNKMTFYILDPSAGDDVFYTFVKHVKTIFWGGSGNDMFSLSGSGNVSVYGGPGDDTVFLGTGKVFAALYSGSDKIEGDLPVGSTVMLGHDNMYPLIEDVVKTRCNLKGVNFDQVGPNDTIHAGGELCP